MTVTNFMASIYFAGVLGYAIHSIYLKSLDTSENMTGLSLKDSLLWNSFLIIRPFLWPLHLLRVGPLDFFMKTISRLFFCNYGDPNKEGRGNERGFYYFLKDCFHGKNRYKEYFCGQSLVKISSDSHLLDYLASETLKQYCHYLQITYGFNELKSDYRLHYFFISSPEIARETYTPYILDDAHTYTKKEFLNKLTEISVPLKDDIENKLTKDEIS